eukprot:CAMPEP_0113896176 /NCGR_PEP_ID=MMETSP0780_2-20120614/17843_1 /TAXON_ID=652834 /ORGANISM="Palpitomonas bilix" /LENGTH=176 /DNA_ID=CAMNT_0000887229 /DNA_START=10 /DNA_END=540 /DNA_ORIENTATION=- /assembly_acc=CAM_ASM_000599
MTRSLALLAIFLACASAVSARALAPASAQLEFKRPLEDVNILWNKCMDVPELGESCIGIFVIADNGTLGVQLNISGHVFQEAVVEGNQVCLDCDSLLELMTDIPVLSAFTPIIKLVEKLHHLIPADVFSICVDIDNMKYDGTYFDGCPKLQATLMCWEGKCLYKGSVDFGCFHVKA